MRSQLVIFEKPTTVGTGNLAGQLNKTNYIKRAEVTANSPLSHLVKDAVIDGKQTFILVDKIINETVDDVDKALWPVDYKILDEFELYYLGNQIWYIWRWLSSRHRQATKRKIVLGI